MEGFLQREVRRNKQKLVTRCADVTEVLHQTHKTEISSDVHGGLRKCVCTIQYTLLLALNPAIAQTNFTYRQVL